MNSHINSPINSTLKRPSQFYDSTKAIYYSKFNELCVNLLAKPNSKLNEITEMKSNCVCVNVNAPPVDGEANRELIKYISSLLRLQENQLKIERGQLNRNKVLIFSKYCKFGMEDLRQILSKECKTYNHSQLRITNFFKC